jgi:hypothetical protein
MQQISPVNIAKIDEITEGDADFKIELLKAISYSLSELKDKYIEGASQKKVAVIQKVIHKVKPSLLLFEITQINELLNKGKAILEVQGFGPDFSSNMETTLFAIEEAIDFINLYLNSDNK